MEIVRKPSSPAMIAVNLNETLIDNELAELIVNEFAKSDRYVNKIAFVGLDKADKKLISSLFKRLDKRVNFGFRFIDDYEKAKEWLVGENEQ